MQMSYLSQNALESTRALYIKFKSSQAFFPSIALATVSAVSSAHYMISKYVGLKTLRDLNPDSRLYGLRTLSSFTTFMGSSLLFGTLAAGTLLLSSPEVFNGATSCISEHSDLIQNLDFQKCMYDLSATPVFGTISLRTAALMTLSAATIFYSFVSFCHITSHLVNKKEAIVDVSTQLHASMATSVDSAPTRDASQMSVAPTQIVPQSIGTDERSSSPALPNASAPDIPGGTSTSSHFTVPDGLQGADDTIERSGGASPRSADGASSTSSGATAPTSGSKKHVDRLASQGRASSPSLSKT